MSRNKIFQIPLAFALALSSAVAFAAGAAPDAPRSLSATGECSRLVKGDRASIKIDIDEEGLNKALMAGLKIVKKGVEKAIDVMENSPKTEVKSNVALSYETTTSKGEKEGADIEMPLRFHIPEVDSENFDPSEFLADIADDIPAYDEVVKTDAKYSLSKERLESEYKSCAEEAMKDARAKAEAEAAKRGLRLKKALSVSKVESRVMEESKDGDGTVKIGVKLDVSFGVE